MSRLRTMLTFAVPFLQGGLGSPCVPHVRLYRGESWCLAPRKRVAVRRRRVGPRSMLQISEASILLAEDIYVRIAKGGVGIIMSGILGAVVVSFLIRKNYDVVRASDVLWSY